MLERAILHQVTFCLDHFALLHSSNETDLKRNLKCIILDCDIIQMSGFHHWNVPHMNIEM